MFFSNLQYTCPGFVANNQRYNNRRVIVEMFNNLFCITPGTGSKNGDMFLGNQGCLFVFLFDESHAGSNFFQINGKKPELP